MFELLIFGFALSLPVFYIWGFIAFIRWANRSVRRPDPPETLQPAPDAEPSALLALLRTQAEIDPDMSVSAFLERLADPTLDDDEDDIGPEPEPTPILTTTESGLPVPLAHDAPETAAETVSESAAEAAAKRTPLFSANWFSDNAVNLLLYLGAFLVIASVSLFVGFQWQNLDSTLRFGVVIGFTLFWYGAGSFTSRVLKLQTVGLTFITLAALLTPFCGVAWQRFVVGSMDGVGATWLLTSVMSTLIYLWLSFAYRRRYFTYFSNLSILAMVLSLVQISDAPPEYFILAASLTSLMLLGTRIAVIRVGGELERFYGRDVEYASLGSVAGAAVIGLIVVIGQDMPFYSVEVLAVLLTTTVYAWVYLTLRQNTATVIIPYVLTVLAAAHALNTFDVGPTPTLYLTALVHIGVWLALDWWLRRTHPGLVLRFNIGAMVLSGLFYVASIGSELNRIDPVLFALLIIAQAAYNAVRLKRPGILHVSGAFACFGAFNALTWLDAGSSAYPPLLMLAPVALILSQHAPIGPFRRPLVRVGWISAMILWLLYMLIGDNLITGQAGRSLLIITLSTVAGVLAVIWHGVWDWRTPSDERLSAGYTWRVLAIGVLVAYLVSWINETPWLTVIMAVSTAAVWFVGYFNAPKALTVVPPVLGVYLVAVQMLDWFAVRDVVYMPVIALVSVLVYFAEIAQPTIYPRARKITVLVILTVALLFAAAWNSDTPFTYALSAWMAGYTLLVLLFAGRDVMPGRLRGYLIAGAGWLLYDWHIYALATDLNLAAFDDLQWYTGALGAVLLLLSWREWRTYESGGYAVLFELGAGAAWFLSSLAQIIGGDSLVYFLVGIAYGLVFVGYGISMGRGRAQQLGTLGIIAVVLAQTSEFAADLPRWVVVGVLGIGLIGAAIWLSLRRRPPTG